MIKQTNKIIAIKVCKNNIAINDLNQTLKKILVLLLDKVRIAKGASIIKTLIRMQRIAQETDKLKNPKVIENFNIPIKTEKNERRRKEIFLRKDITNQC